MKKQNKNLFENSITIFFEKPKITIKNQFYSLLFSLFKSNFQSLFFQFLAKVKLKKRNYFFKDDSLSKIIIDFYW
jgi:hypothetical protein